MHILTIYRKKNVTEKYANAREAFLGKKKKQNKIARIYDNWCVLSAI